MWRNVFYTFIAIIVYILRNINSHRHPTDFNAQSKEILAKYGTQPISELLIVRRPINSIIQNALRAISFGMYDQACNSLGIKRLNHVALMVSLDISGQQQQQQQQRKYILIEKTHTANISEARLSPTADYYICDLPAATTLQGMVDTIRRGDEGCFKYDMIDNNCHTFVSKALQSLNVYNQGQDAIIQDIDGFYDQMPAYVGAVSKCFLEVRHAIKNYIDSMRLSAAEASQ